VEPLRLASGEKDERTGKAMTGTEEEFKRAYAAWKASGGQRPHIAVYRCERPANTKGKGAQILAVDEFFEQLNAEKEYEALSFSFTETQEFKDAVEEHLVDIVGRIRAAKKASLKSRRNAEGRQKKQSIGRGRKRFTASTSSTPIVSSNSTPPRPALPSRWSWRRYSSS
jgi:hypothetical protein